MATLEDSIISLAEAIGNDIKHLGKRRVELTSWPPSFLLPNTVYTVLDYQTKLASEYVTDETGEVFLITNPDGVLTVITQVFVNSAGEPLK